MIFHAFVMVSVLCGKTKTKTPSKNPFPTLKACIDEYKIFNFIPAIRQKHSAILSLGYIILKLQPGFSNDSILRNFVSVLNTESESLVFEVPAKIDDVVP